MFSGSRRAALALFALSFLVRLTLLYGFHRWGGANSECVGIARSLARSGAFADPYSIPTGPTAHCAPLYPAMSAPFYAILGDTPRADLARYTLNAAVSSAGYALLPAIAEALELGSGAGIAAGFAGAVVPLHYWPDTVNDFENAWTALFLEIAVLWFVRLLGRPATGLREATLGGALWSFGLLLAPTVGPVLACLTALGCGLRRMRARWLLMFAATVVLLLAPWTVRNYLRLGGFVLVRDNFGLELSVSNRDDATPVEEWNMGRTYWAATHPHSGVPPARELQRVGELAFNRQLLHEAVAWIAAHPARFVKLSAGRALRFWFPFVPRFQWAMWSVTLLALCGFVRLWRKRRTAAIVLGTVMAAYSLPFWIIQNTLRYQHPIWWALLLLAACAFWDLGYTKRLRSTPDAT